MRDALACAAAHPARFSELLLCDPDFADWPLGERPVVEHLPAEPGRSKESGMALLHSFYCWGQLAVVLGSTALLARLGTASWWILPLAWAAFFTASTFTR